MRSRLIAVLVAAAAAAACSDAKAPTQPESFSVPLHVEAAQKPGTPENHRAHLNGANEVPARDTLAQGQAIFQLNADGTELRFRLIVANIENVTQAHIHCCVNTEGNAGVVAWLYPAGPPAQLIPGRTQGTLAEGVITQASLVGSLAGSPLSVLVDRINSGLAYVNVHTSQFPPGEIRGQIE